MKVKCSVCERMVSVKLGIVVKHRTGRSKPNKVQRMCAGSLWNLKKQPLAVKAKKVKVEAPKAPEHTPAQAAFAEVVK